MTPTQSETSGTQRRSELAELRRELRDKQSYLSDDREDLWTEISLWLLESYNAPVGSLRTKVRTRLASLQEDPLHKLYDHPGVDDGEAAFPDACDGCPHYGVQCPVLARDTTKQTLERHFDEAEDDDKLQGRLSRYAAKNHCQVIQAEIAEWEEGYAKFLSRGERLRIELNADINGKDLDDLPPSLMAALATDDETTDGDETADGETETSSVAGLAGATGADGGSSLAVADGSGDGPPPEDAERVARVTQSLLEDDEEDDA